MKQTLLHLASASQRRRDILTNLGIEHTWSGVDIDETPRKNEAPGELVLRLATGKATAYREKNPGPELILGADTVVAHDGRIFGKPATKEDALSMLSRLSGRTHTVMTAVALLQSDRVLTAVSATEVTFRVLEPDEALAYWETGEPMGKAGAYAVQGRGGIFVAALSGSYSGVVGLPVFETASLLRSAGVNILAHGQIAHQD